MEDLVKVLGWFFLASIAAGVLGGLAIMIARQFVRSRPPQIVGAELPILDSGIDLAKRYDLVYAAGHGTGQEKMTGVRILGYLRSDRDQTTGDYMDSRWLVIELEDGRRAYLRPRSVLWLLETIPLESHALP